MSAVNRLCAAALLVFSVAAPEAAFAGRPLVTEDAGVLAAGECEIETWFGRARESGAAHVDGAWLQPSCGLPFPLASQIGVALSAEHGGDGRTPGWAISGKTALRKLTDEQWGFALAWSTARTRVAGDSWRQSGASVLAVLSVPIESDLLAHANLGWTRSEAPRHDAVFWSVAMEKTGVGPFDLMAETYATGGESAWVNTGLRYWVVRERLSLNASAGVKPSGTRETLYTLGAKLSF